jgi:anti-sigma regulatory factor (Ser/Thr protein kinase)
MSTGYVADRRRHDGKEETIPFDEGSLALLRRKVWQWATRQGLSAERTEALVLAIHELAANSVRHGPGAGVVHLWKGDGRLCCEVTDRGVFKDPSLLARPPDPAATSGRGLWIVHELCDDVDITTGPLGTVARIQMELDR